MAISYKRILRHAAVAALVVGTLAGISTFVAPHYIKKVALAQIEERTGRKAAIGEVSFNPFGLTLTVKDIALMEPDGTTTALSAKKLVASASTASLFNMAPVLDELTLVAPSVHLVRLSSVPEETNNFSDVIERLASKDDDTSDTLPAFALEDINIIDGRATIDDKVTGKQTRVEALNLTLPYISTFKRKVNTDIKPYLSVVINDTPFLLKARSKPFSGSKETVLGIDIEQLDLVQYLPYMPVSLPVKIASATLSTQLNVSFTDDNGAPNLSLTGDVSLTNLSVRDRADKPLIQSDAVDVRLKDLDVFTQSGTIEHILLDKPQVWADMSKDGVLNWSKLGNRKDAPQGKAHAAEATSSSPHPALQLNALAINDGSFYWKDAAHATPQQETTLSDITFRATNLSTRPGAPAGELHLSLTDHTQGSLQLDGQLQAMPLSFNGQLTLDKIGLAAYQPYLTYANAGLFDGQLGGKTDIAFREGVLTLNSVHAGLTNLSWTSPNQQSLSKVPEKERLHAVQLTLDLDTFTSAMDQPGKFLLQGQIDKSGKININGTHTAGYQAITLDADIRDFPVMPFQSYFQEYLNAQMDTGAITARVNASMKLPRGQQDFALDLKGNGSLLRFNLLEKVTSHTFLRWNALDVDGIRLKIGQEPLFVNLDKISLKRFFARATLLSEGRLDLQDLIVAKKEDASSPAATTADTTADTSVTVAAAAQATTPPPVIRIGQVQLDRGIINFTDNFVKPNYRVNMMGISGSIGEFASNKDKPATIDIKGKVDNTAPLQISGAINPLLKPIYLDIQGNANGIELTRLTPYSAKYAGYPITKGKLSVTANYKVEAEHLLASNEVNVDQLTFGQYVAGPDVTSLPVTLAVALLRDRNGQINVNLPISGSLSDPEFSVGGIIMRVFVNMIVKAVTSPFALIGSLFGGGEELSYAEFTAGTATLTAPVKEKLDQLAKALDARPGLKLDITGLAGSQDDMTGFARETLTRQMRGLKRDALQKNQPDVGMVTLSPEDIDKYTKVLYRKATFEKPKNMIGFDKSIPREDMERLLIAHIKVSDEDMRNLARRRAENVMSYLEETGKVAAERMFLLAPDVMQPTTGDKQDKPAARVDFSLK